MDPIKLMNSSHTYYNEPQLEALPFYPWQIILIMIYSTTAFISLGSNALTIIILLRNEQVSTELWKFLLNLSISDITMALFCIPFTYTNYMLGRWIFPHFLCPIIPFFQVTAVSVSIWTLTIIGIDRFFAIIYPFRSMLWLKRHKITTIFSIWLFGASIASPLLFYSRIESFQYRGENYDDCREQFSNDGGRIYTIFIFLFTFFLPIMALIFVYARICIHLIRNTTVPGNPDQNRDKYCVNKKIKVIKMLVTIVVLFAMCWFPIHLFQLLVWFHPTIQNQKTTFSYYLYVGSYFVCHWLAMAHSFVNPFVYCFMSGNFRSLGKTLSRCWPRLFQKNNSNYHSTTITLDPNHHNHHHHHHQHINKNHNHDHDNRLSNTNFDHHHHIMIMIMTTVMMMKKYH
ncbi:galanin receptor type 1 isoform X3 [Dermatophagoides farinae]|uniref:galanin receptor type 1 isoform X3 n=1 Tax=Dermatophagoides farinae TaxID=6954 RepID=UPI003F5EA686